MRVFLVFLFLCGPLCAVTEQQWVKRIYAHHLIGDDFAAVEDAKLALKEWPESKELIQSFIKCLAKIGDEKRMMSVWEQYRVLFPEASEERQLVESMAWGVIGKGIHSSYPNIRVIAMLGAFFSQDTKGVEQLTRCLRDKNSLIRAAGIRLASNLHDAKLCDEVLYRFRHEKIWGVRLEAIKALGSMRLAESKDELVTIVAHDRTTAEEKAAAIQSLVQLFDTAERKEIEKLACSDRVGLRLLACQIVEHFSLHRDVELIEPLLRDYHPDVRAHALHVMGMFRAENTRDAILPLLEDTEMHVAMTAAWALTLMESDKGEAAFSKWLQHRNVEVSRMAAAVLATTGSYGIKLMIQAFEEAKDPYVQLNLALGLMTQRDEVERACTAIYEGFVHQQERWMWKQYPFFRVLVPCKMRQDTLIPQHPEEINQLVRLDILNMLATLKHPHAIDAVKVYLQKKQWGITGLVSTLLLTEGDESAIELVQQLMLDDDLHVRFQAALIVALWGRSDSAITVLQNGYDGASRELKERILEGLGRIGAKSSVPFLLDKLHETAQPLRLIAAAALLQCLYH